ncbi:MAG: histidine phosphatase family protein [Prolixibacteraceae bacterium]|jgi:phosphohistidine phosphatase|nr:histidine phosphatase family protein [Prolixibacteraceae bacterium]
MKRLIIVRHAKTIQYGYDQDYDRTLTERGEDNADRISNEMVKIGIVPDLIISSPAVRTTQTTRIYAGNFGYPKENIRYEKRLYSGMQTTTFLQFLHELDDRHTSVMVVGHNPTIYFYLEFLLPDFSLDVPTCSTIVIDFKIHNWAELRAHSGIIMHRWIPDLL